MRDLRKMMLKGKSSSTLVGVSREAAVGLVVLGFLFASCPAAIRAGENSPVNIKITVGNTY